MMRKPLGRGLDALIGTAAAGIEIGADNESGAGRYAPLIGKGSHFTTRNVRRHRVSSKKCNTTCARKPIRSPKLVLRY